MRAAQGKRDGSLSARTGRQRDDYPDCWAANEQHRSYQEGEEVCVR